MSDEPLYCTRCGDEWGGDCKCDDGPGGPDAEDIRFCNICGDASRVACCEECGEALR